MSNNPLSKSIISLRGVGEQRAKQFSKLGIDDVRSLIYFFPRDYEDWSEISAISSAPFDTKCTVMATVSGPVAERRTQRGKMMYTTTVTDGRDVMKIVIFNNKYAAQRLTVGKTYVFYGKIGGNYTSREMVSPLFEEAEKGERIRPVYPCTAGLTSRIISNTVKGALELAGDIVVDPLPVDIRKKYELCDLKYALFHIHFPKDMKEAEIARKRLVFEELFVLQLGMMLFREKSKTFAGAVIKKDYSDEYFAQLPFEPTSAQIRVVNEAVEDMKSGIAMNRMVQGDVGSGKTAVSAALMYTVVKNGHQSVLMAPTEILAEQHYNNLSPVFEKNGLKTALLIGSLSAANKKKLYEQIKNGEVDIIIGTNAVMQEKVEYNNLGLVITDEQHRFGVAQRSKLVKKGNNPHVMVMSATPIPRTLSHVIFGDLEISVLDCMPKGRQKVETYCVNSSYRSRIYEYMRKFFALGKQGYVVCPLIEESEMSLESAEKIYEELKNKVFPEYNVGLLHGKMSPTEKEGIMADFAENKIQLLVSTTVIEVGVDVKNALIMVIENAERFGLSQLHQLRGRVGRGKEKATCILISDADNSETKERLSIICETTDGFKIADEDLKLRGPGDFFGERQHGLPKLKIADLAGNFSEIKRSSHAAKELIAKDPTMSESENRYLKASIKRMFDSGNFISEA